MDNEKFTQYYLGIRISQNDNAIPTFDRMFKELEFNNTPIKRIIELGTFHGGLSVFLGIYCFMKNIPFITYDIKPFVHELSKVNNLFKSLNIDYRIKNINDSFEEIKNEIEKDGVTLLLCDGGDKVNEFNTFSNYLKTNDIIMAHDYAVDTFIFENEIKNKLWNWHEIQFSQIQDACEKNNLKDYMKDDFEKAVWVCKRK